MNNEIIKEICNSTFIEINYFNGEKYHVYINKACKEKNRATRNKESLCKYIFRLAPTREVSDDGTFDNVSNFFAFNVLNKGAVAGMVQV